MKSFFDQLSRDSVFDFASHLLGKTLRKSNGVKNIPEKYLKQTTGSKTRGSFGDVLENYYFGITLKFIIKHTKRKIMKTNIYLQKINEFDEILLVGSGKGVVALNNIPQLRWKNKGHVIYKELQELYNSNIER